MQVQTSTGFLTRVSATRPVDPEIIVTPPPTPSVTFNLMTGTSSGKPVNPFTLRARFTNYPGVSIRWTASSAGNGTGYVAFGPTATQPSIQVLDPVIVSEYVTDLAATITLGFNPIYTVNMGITVNVSACMERDGAPILLSTGAPWCIRREYLY